jgi:UDP-N-acetyl-D-mannosaminuronic acid transferase (WecB/TagA/CpsF family)
MSLNGAPDQSWLRRHRTQIAIAITAVAGGGLQMLARRRKR